MGVFNIKDALLDVIGYKGLPYPGLWLPGIKRDGETGREFECTQEENRLKTHSALGSVLRKRDAQGRYYFCRWFYSIRERSMRYLMPLSPLPERKPLWKPRWSDAGDRLRN